MTGKTPWNKGLDKSDARVAAGAKTLSENTKGRFPNWAWTAERRQLKSNWKKQQHKENPGIHPNRLLAGNRNRWTYPEQIAAEWLDENEVSYQYNPKIGKYYPDFVVGNIIIEIDGERWHDSLRDSKRDAELVALGYTVHRIKSKEKIRERLKELLGV